MGIMLARREATPYEEGQYQMAMRLFGEMQIWRINFAGQWEEVAELIDAPSRNTFMYGSFNWPGQKKTQQQIDASGMVALERFSAILDSLLTPRNTTWHTLASDNDYVNKDRQTQLWFEKATKALFKYRYDPNANFSAQNNAYYRSLGAYGTAGMFVDEFDSPHRVRGIRYRCLPLGELYLLENHQGLIDGFIRHFRLTARQAFQKFGQKLPEFFQQPLDQNSQMLYDFLHVVIPRADFEPGVIGDKGKPYYSCYITIQGKMLLSEGGYYTFPLAASRYIQAPQEVYGRGVAMQVLPALKTLNNEKKVFLKQGHRAADPVLLTQDDGLVGMNLRPGAMNPGGVTSDGKPLVHVLPTGEIQITEKMMAEEKMLINDMFLVNLFQILTETPQMSATEVIERINEKGILLAPTVGRQQSEYLGALIPRELDLLMRQGLLDPMPARLREARGEYQVVYTSPLSRMMRAGEASGFWRAVEQAVTVVNITQDPSPLDAFDFDVAIPETAEIYGTLPSWMADDRKIAQKRRARAQAQATQQQIQAAPAQAAMMKAQAVQKQAGMQPQGAPQQ